MEAVAGGSSGTENHSHLPVTARASRWYQRLNRKQDVIALFHELLVWESCVVIASLELRKMIGTTPFMEYLNDDKVLFNTTSQRLGVNRGYKLPYTTEPKVLEYKYTFDSLVDDFEKRGKICQADRSSRLLDRRHNF